MKPKTYVLLILDRSGSMESCRQATIVAFNEKIQQFKLDAAEQDYLVSLYSFNGSVYEHCVNVPATEMVELTEEDYVCGGSTGYYKAIGHAVSTLRDLTKDETGDVAHLVEIISDGENTDHHPDYTREMVTALIADQEKTGRWTFGYIGASRKLAEDAADMIKIRGNIAIGNLSNNVFAASSYAAANAGTQNFMRARKRSAAGGQSVLRSSNLYNINENKIADFFEGDAVSNTLTSTGNNSGTVDAASVLFKSVGKTSKGLKGKIVKI